MKDISKIVNLNQHPINNTDYVNECNLSIKKNSLLILENFLTKDSFYLILNEAKNLEKNAFYCEQKHTILLNNNIENKNENDPLNKLMTSDKGCVPHDLIDEQSDLNILYNSNNFKNFIKKVLNLNNIFPYVDKLSSINLNYYQKGQQLGWHFDNASFAITLMIQSSKLGGEFEYITEGRDSNSNYINKELISEIIEGNIKPKKLHVNDGTLVLFYGRNYLHRVTPVDSESSRILITLNYNEEDNVSLSENARLTFFGRIS